MSYNLAGLNAISPQVSKAYEKDLKEFGPPETLNEKEGYRESELDTEVLAHEDDHHSHNLPMEVFMHYAEIQRSFEYRQDFDGLYEEQRKQLSDPHSNLSERKLDTQRKLRSAKIYSVFFLITTDILGPANAPYAIAQMGYVPGIILYILFGVFAAIGGYMLNYCYLKLDSNNFPVRTYSDLGNRAVGRWIRYPLALLQFFQLIFNVGLICLSSGQALAQIIKSTPEKPILCFAICVLVWALLGMVLGQIRSLRNFSHIANLAVWLNISVCVITMVGAAVGPPNFSVSISNYGDVFPYNTHKILRYAISPGTLSQRIGGMNNMVFAWGGATIFCEVMAELRQPRDFWKGMIMGQGLIMVVYLFFGLFVYSYQGQWSYVTANMGISQYKLQTASNVLNLVSGVLAAVLYGNVGLKVLYQGFLMPDFGFPPLTTFKGTITWGAAVVIYWAVAYVVGCGIPSISVLVSLIGAICIFNFSYTFPAVFLLSLLMKIDASGLDKIDVPAREITRYDSWASPKRWFRGFSTGGRNRVLFKAALLTMVLASLCTCALCFYSAILAAEDVWSHSAATSFGCSPPV